VLAAAVAEAEEMILVADARAAELQQLKTEHGGETWRALRPEMAKDACDLERSETRRAKA
jgi:hypothetical protein